MARKGQAELVPPNLTQCPWHDACGCCLISYCWQLKHKHAVIFLDEIVQTFQNSLCVQICMLSESATHAHGIYGKRWEIWKEIVWEAVFFFFLNINPQTVSLNIPHVCAAINTWHFCFSLCVFISGFCKIYFWLFFASPLSCLLHLEDPNPASMHVDSVLAREEDVKEQWEEI